MTVLINRFYYAKNFNYNKIKMTKVRPLLPNLQKIAEEELNEVPERIEQDLNDLRNWIEKQPHLIARTSDQFLIAFLRTSKYSLEKAKIKLDKYYSLQQAIPEVFKDRTVDNPKVLQILREGIVLRLKVPPNDNAPCVSIIRAGGYDTWKYSLSDIIKVGTMIGDIQLLEDDSSVVAGIVEIMDMSNITGSHFFQLNPVFLNKCFVYAAEAMPIRQKGTHFIRTPIGFETSFNTITKIMSEKATKRFFSHGNNMERLYEHIPKKYLPIEYGGENGTIQDIIEHWEEKLLSYRGYFLEESKYGSDESLRSDQSSYNLNNIFGIAGSFRQLNVD